MKPHLTRVAIAAAITIVLLAGPGTTATADTATSTSYYVSLGDSLAESFQPNGVRDHGYAEQLHQALVADTPKLKLVKLGCGGESTGSMRFGSQPPDLVLSCGTPQFYKDTYPKGTQLAEAISFLQGHKGKVALVTIDLGANDMSRFDQEFNVISCLFPPEDCDAQGAAMAQNLAAILTQLRAAAGPGIPIIGMTYYDVFAPLANPVVTDRVAALNRILAQTYAAAGVPVADVAGAFENGVVPDSADNVCAWTWFCALGDVHPNTAGYGIIADEFLKVIP